MADDFETSGAGLESPFSDGEPIVVDQAFTKASRSIYVGTTGHVTFVTVRGTTVQLKNHPVGYIPVRATIVNSSGTTASDLVAVW